MKILFQIMPFLINVIVGLFFFVSAKRMADSGANSFMIAATMVIWAVFYAGTALVLGRVMTKWNAVRILISSLITLIFATLGMLFVPNLYGQYVWMLCTGVGAAMFFPPFQMVVRLFSKEVYSFKALVKSTAVYTFSWSFGLACGPMLAAVIWGLFEPENGWKYCYLITLAMLLFMVFCAVFLKKFVQKRLAEAGETPVSETPSEPPDAPGLPDLMIAAWIMEFLGYMVITMLRTYLPDFCTTRLQMNTFQQGTLLMMISAVQAFTGLCFMKAGRSVLFRPKIPALLTLCGAGAMLIFALTSTWEPYLIAAVLLGICSGTFCFISTFHALINFSKTAKYVAGVETIVGTTSVLAPLFGGWLATEFGGRVPFFYGSALFLLSAVVFVLLTWKKTQS